MDLQNMNKKALTDYAESLGVKVLANDNTDQIKAKILAVTGDAPEQTTETVMTATNAAGSKANDPDEELTVSFHTGAEGDNTNVVFGINGTLMSLPRNKAVKVKRKYLNMLAKECVGYRVEMIEVNGEQVTNKIPVPVYTWSVIDQEV